VQLCENVNDIVIGGDYNQFISANKIQQFYIPLGVRDVYLSFNIIELDQIDHAYKDRSKAIDSIAITEGLQPYLEGSKLNKINEVIQIDHQSIEIDLNLK